MGTSFFRTLIVSIVMFLIDISFITCMIGLIRKQCTKAIVTAMQIDLYLIPDWIPPYDDVDDLGTQLKLPQSVNP